MPLVVTVDANILMSALLGGQPYRLLLDLPFSFITTERTIWEVKRYIPFLAKKLRSHESDLLTVLESLPIVAYQERDYQHKLVQAGEQIAARDPKDTDILALAVGCLLWSQDRDFEQTEGIVWLTTAQMAEFAVRT